VVPVSSSVISITSLRPLYRKSPRALGRGGLPRGSTQVRRRILPRRTLRVVTDPAVIPYSPPAISGIRSRGVFPTVRSRGSQPMAPSLWYLLRSVLVPVNALECSNVSLLYTLSGRCQLPFGVCPRRFATKLSPVAAQHKRQVDLCPDLVRADAGLGTDAPAVALHVGVHVGTFVLVDRRRPRANVMVSAVEATNPGSTAHAPPHGLPHPQALVAEALDARAPMCEPHHNRPSRWRLPTRTRLSPAARAAVSASSA
jgi:hypothetical protein